MKTDVLQVQYHFQNNKENKKKKKGDLFYHHHHHMWECVRSKSVFNFTVCCRICLVLESSFLNGSELFINWLFFVFFLSERCGFLLPMRLCFLQELRSFSVCSCFSSLTCLSTSLPFFVDKAISSSSEINVVETYDEWSHKRLLYVDISYIRSDLLFWDISLEKVIHSTF